MRLGAKLWVFAAALGMALAALWTWSAWDNLSHLRLPDTDDMARLQQVRDWLNGQAWGDLVQHRLGDGVTSSLHWSRLADLGLAAWIMLLTPLLGHHTDVWAAILWPTTLYVLFLAASARLAMRLGGRESGGPAIIVSALAFPAITMFLPGRIDHHGLQILLTVLLVDALVRPPSARAGMLAGVLAALSLAIGLETAPQVACAMAVLFGLWIVDGARQRSRLTVFGATLGGATILWRIVAQPSVWSPQWCDGFTPASYHATLIAAGLFMALGGLVSRTTRLRLIFGTALGLIALALTYRTSGICLAGPYGATDPLLRRLWMDRIQEVRGLFAKGETTIAIGFGALPILGVLVSAWLLWRARTQEWLIVLGFSGVALIVALFQVRGAAMAAALAVPPLAVVVAECRHKRPVLAVGAWLCSIGLVWNLLGVALQPAQAKPAHGAGCSDWRTIDQLRALPPAKIVAPIDAGAYVLALTNHSVLAAPYHRNNAGNRAAYDFWLSRPPAAHALAGRWGVKYVLYCADSFGGIDLDREGPGGIAALLGAHRRPIWLQPIPLKGSRASLFRILPPPPSKP